MEKQLLSNFSNWLITNKYYPIDENLTYWIKNNDFSNCFKFAELIDKFLNESPKKTT